MSKSIQSSNADHSSDWESFERHMEEHELSKDAREMFRRLRRHSKSLKPHYGDEGTHEEWCR